LLTSKGCRSGWQSGDHRRRVRQPALGEADDPTGRLGFGERLASVEDRLGLGDSAGFDGNDVSADAADREGGGQVRSTTSTTRMCPCSSSTSTSSRV
jgi:hypothetical protein